MRPKTKPGTQRHHQRARGNKTQRARLALLLATTVLLAGAGGPVSAVAQVQTQANGVVAFDIPAQPLSGALDAFSRTSGWEIGYSSAIVQGKTSRPLAGSLAPTAALQTLLAGTGIQIRIIGPRNAALIDTAAASTSGNVADGETVLAPITIQGSSPWGPVGGIAAERTATASKTDAAILDVPSSVSVIGETEIERRGVQNLDQALNYTSGVTTNAYGADKRYDFFTIRGFPQEGTGTYRDGLPVGIDNFMGSRMEPYGMQRIEVLKGSTSTLYGQNGPGGLVNMITKRPQPHKFGEIYTTFGDEHLETGTDFGGPIDEDGVWSYRLTGKWQNGQDGHDWANDDRFYIAPALTWSPTDATTLTILSDYNKRKSANRYGIPLGADIDPETFLGEPDFDKNDTVEKNIGYIFDHDFGNGLKFHQNARYTDLTLSHEDVYFANTAPPQTRRLTMAVDGELERFAIDTNGQYETSFGAFDSRTLFGFDYSRSKGNEYRVDGMLPGVGSDLSNPIYCGRSCITVGGLWTQNPFVLNTESSGEERTFGAYVQEELTIADRWILTAGLRYDDVSNKAVSINNTVFGIPVTLEDDVENDALTKRIGLTWKATDEFSIYGGYSESFNPVAPIVGTMGFVDTPDPMEGTLYEIGAKFQPSGMDAIFSAALFDLTQTNLPYNVGGGRQGQIGEIKVRGLELEAKTALTDQLNLTFAYTYMNSEIVREGTGLNDGNQMQFIPKHMASAWIDYTIAGNGYLGDLTLGAGARFVGSRFANNANTVKLDSYTVFDAGLHYKINDTASLAVNVTNLFDKEYVSYVETWSTPDTAFYGDRRTVKATLKYTW